MQRKFLEDLGLTKEQIDSVMAVNGDDINKAKADLADVKEQLKKANETISERDTQLEELKKVDAEGLQAEITKLQEANKTAKTEYEQQLAQLKLSNAIKLAITDAQDVDLVISQLDQTKLKLGEDGKLIGLDEQLKTLRESKGFLFKTEQITTSGFKPNQSNNSTGGITKEQFAKMTYREKVDLYNSNQALYDQLSNEQ
nr:MAG TPA: minor structural protein [Caudoviricetes sp.]